MAGAGTRPARTLEVSRGVVRLFVEMGISPLLEFSLVNGRRVDVAGLTARGRIVFAEVKSCRADFEVDDKWMDYLPYCDAFYFAVAPDFPREILPRREGLIFADAYGGAELVRPEDRPLAPARRKAVTLRFARQAALRAARGAETGALAPRARLTQGSAASARS